MAYKTQSAKHRKACINQVIDDGCFQTANDARKYELDEDGTFRLNEDSFTWFKVGIHLLHVSAPPHPPSPWTLYQ